MRNYSEESFDADSSVNGFQLDSNTNVSNTDNHIVPTDLSEVSKYKISFLINIVFI